MPEIPGPRPAPRDGHRFRVAVILPDCPLRALVAAAVERAGAVSIRHDDVTLRVPDARVAAVIVRLARPLTGELARLQSMAPHLAHVPALTYTEGTMAPGTECWDADWATRRLRVASAAAGDRDVTRDIAWLVRAVSPCALTRLVTVLVPDLPLVGRGYIAEFLWELAMRPQDITPNVASVAAALGTSRSMLEHLLSKKTPLPPPKELADWLTLLLATYQARGLGVTSHHVSADLGLDRHRWSRLHTRLLRAYSLFTLLPAATQFDLALAGFAQRASVARRRLATALRVAR